METNLQEAKLELIQWLAAIDDPNIIEQIRAIRDKEKDDWWDKLSAPEKESINKGIEDAEAGNLKDQDWREGLGLKDGHH